MEILFLAVSEAKYTWSGTLPPKAQKSIGYSTKVFVGGSPWDVDEHTLINTFKQFGQIKIEWPGKDATSKPKGYVYIIFESEKQVNLNVEKFSKIILFEDISKF